MEKINLEKFRKKWDKRTIIPSCIYGIGGITLITFKCLGYCSLPWVWVLSPFWLPIALSLILVVGIVALMWICKVDIEKFNSSITAPHFETPEIKEEDESPKPKRKRTASKRTKACTSGTAE